MSKLNSHTILQKYPLWCCCHCNVAYNLALGSGLRTGTALLYRLGSGLGLVLVLRSFEPISSTASMRSGVLVEEPVSSIYWYSIVVVVVVVVVVAAASLEKFVPNRNLCFCHPRRHPMRIFQRWDCYWPLEIQIVDSHCYPLDIS